MKMKKMTLVLAVSVAFFASNLIAGYNPAINPLDPGQEMITIVNPTNGFTFEGQINYDVYAPGEFTDAITANGGTEIPASAFTGQYVYTYQIASTQGFGDSLGVAIDPGSSSSNFGYASSPASGVLPMFVFDAANLVSYSFVVAAGESTTALLFTSPYGPKAGNAMVHGMIAGSQAVVVPVPVPEPITLILLGAGCLPLRYYRKRSR